MFYLFKDGVIQGECNNYIEKKGCITINRDEFNETDKHKLFNGCLFKNGEIVITDEYIENKKNYEKQLDIEKYKTLEQEAISLRTEYLTAEKMPDGTLKQKKMAKILDEEKVVLEKYNTFILELKDKYGDQIEEELI